MFGQGNYNPQPGQGSQAPIPPHPPPPPSAPLSHNFQQGSLVPPPRAVPCPRQPSLHMYQHPPMASHLAAQQPPPGGMSNLYQSHGHTPLPHMYTACQQLSQHPSYLPPPGPPLPSSLGSHRPEMVQARMPHGGLIPPSSQGQVVYRAPGHQAQELSGGVQGLQYIPRPPPPPPTYTPLISVQSGSAQNVSMSLPPPPPPPPLTSPPPIPPPSPSMALDLPPLPPKPAEEKAVPMIEGLCQPNQMIAAITDYDMEMEDDITQTDYDEAVNHPVEGQTHPHNLTGSEFDVGEQVHGTETSAEPNGAMVVLSEKASSELGSKVNSVNDYLALGRSASQVHVAVTTLECPSADNRENSTAQITIEKFSTRALEATVKCSNVDDYSSPVMKDGSPIKLLQDYASDESSENDEKPHLKGANPKTVSLPKNLHRDIGFDLDRDARSKSTYKNEKGSEMRSRVTYSAHELSSDSQCEIKNTVLASTASASTAPHVDSMQKNQASVGHIALPKSSPKKDDSGGAWMSAAFSGGSLKDNGDKNANFTPDAQKIDKFGRLVREGGSDSDTDDSVNVERRRRRGKSHSRSRSPLDRRRRRRSPRMRREKRSRSRSWSPRPRRSRSRSFRNRRSRSRSPRNCRSRSRSLRNQRSRSRSPSHRHAIEFSSGKMRRDKGPMPECFDFLRGRCYRGASCRYLHNDSEKIVGSRHLRGKQQNQLHRPSSKSFSAYEEVKKTSLQISDHQHEIISQEIQLSHDITASSVCATNNRHFVHERELSAGDAMLKVNSNEDSQLIDSDIIGSNSLREINAKVLEAKAAKKASENRDTHAVENFCEVIESEQPLLVVGFSSEPLGDADILKAHGKASQDGKDSAFQQSHSDLLDSVLEEIDHPDQPGDDSSISDFSPNKAATTSPKKLADSETLPNVVDSVSNPSQLPSFPLSSPLSGANALGMTRMPWDYNWMPHATTSQSQSAPLQSYPPHMLPNQNTLFPVPPKSSLVSLPKQAAPLPLHNSTVNVGAVLSSVSLQFQQDHMPLRNALGSQMFLRPYSTGLPGNFQVGEFQYRAHPSGQEPHRFLVHAEDARSKPPPGCNQSIQQFGGPSLAKEDHLTQPPMPGLSVLDSFTQGNDHGRPVLFSQESPTNKKKSFPGDYLSPAEIKSSSEIHPYPQQQQPPYGLHHSSPGDAPGLPAKICTSARYPPDILDTNQPSRLPDFEVLRNSTHYNPYASTFDQPLSSRFSSDVFRHGKDALLGSNYYHPLSSNYASIDGQGVGDAGSRQTTSSPNYARGVGKILPGSGADQYDPLFDSIEPSSNATKKFDSIQKREPSNNSDILRQTGSNQPLDVEENNMKKEIDGIALASTDDNEEFGETADAEVGDVENGSQSNLNAMENVDMGDMEIDQIKSAGKNKKSKESRSMKLFKVCLANFVKEVLKPSWRQGNMSKETFKTVVKKTVDKVSGAMKNHQMPKSKTKINQYIDSSQRKLTKLVMGYVDKYAKG